MSAPAKGKQATRGQKQIYEENQSTVKFYAVMTFATASVHFSVNQFLFTASFWSWMAFYMSLLCQMGSVFLMLKMAGSVKNEKGHVIDAGLDLNCEGGIAEYGKDIIILSSTIQLISLCSEYFWYSFLLAPMYALYKLWVGIISPWIFAPSAAPEDDDEKKRKKRERKMAKRM